MKFIAAATAALFAATAVAAPVEMEKRGGSWSGMATYFYQNGNPGACGWYSQDSDYVVALYSGIYGGGYACGGTITLQNDATGQQIQATIADECPTCDPNGPGIDLSVGAFNALGGSENAGEMWISYWF